MALIKGITIKLYEKTETGKDPFGAPICTETAKDIENVLIKPVSEEDAAQDFNLTGKKIVYELCIPKGNQDDWINRKVSFYDQDFKTVGKPIELIESMVPLDWNKKIKVEQYE